MCEPSGSVIVSFGLGTVQLRQSLDIRHGYTLYSVPYVTEIRFFRRL